MLRVGGDGDWPQGHATGDHERPVEPLTRIGSRWSMVNRTQAVVLWFVVAAWLSLIVILLTAPAV